jgi:hypothetical protein
MCEFDNKNVTETAVVTVPVKNYITYSKHLKE